MTHLSVSIHVAMSILYPPLQLGIHRVDFLDFLEKWISGKVFFLLVDVFFEIGFGTRMVSGAFSNFEIEN